MRLTLNLNSADDYRLFLKIKALPTYRFIGREAIVPDEYVSRLGVDSGNRVAEPDYEPLPGLFDYQESIARLAIRKRKFAVFARPGLGKTLVMCEFARHAARVMPDEKCVLIISPLMVIKQTLAEAQRFYGDSLEIEQVRAKDLPNWTSGGDAKIGITNFEALSEKVPQGDIGCLCVDESSVMKSHYGKWGREIIRLGKGLDWKLALTGTPAPNDRIEYANHAVFLDAFPTVNSFLSRYFINRGQTQERWEMKPHAIGPFYRALSHWCIFLSDPATYGWKDNVGTIPPVHVHIHDVDLTESQNAAVREITGTMFTNHVGGIVNRSKLARIAKSGDSNKPAFIRNLIESWPDRSTLVWCRYNEEQDRLAAEIPGAASIAGKTKEAERERIIQEFQAGRIKTIVTKADLLGFGLNLQICTRQIFSSLHDSYEEMYQAIMRSNRVGSTEPLEVHIPVTEAERPMIETVLRKAKRVEQDTAEQEKIFKDSSLFAA